MCSDVAVSFDAEKALGPNNRSIDLVCCIGITHYDKGLTMGVTKESGLKARPRGENSLLDPEGELRNPPLPPRRRQQRI